MTEPHATTDMAKRYLTPVIGVPLLQSFVVTHGPAGLLGRFFLNVDYRMREHGIEFSFAEFGEVAETQSRNVANWSWMNPMFDPRVADIPAGRSFCIVARDRHGVIVATASAKLMDASVRSFSEIVNSGEFFALRPEDNLIGQTATLYAPVATTMHGQIAYVGGIWVHPDYRGLRLAALLSRLVNACIITLWNADLSIGFVRAETENTGYHLRYGFKHYEPSLVIRLREKVLIEAILLWMSATDAAEDIAHFLDTLWPEIDTGVVARSGKKSA